MSKEVVYICAATGESVISKNGLPAEWVIPLYDLSFSEDAIPMPKYTVRAFSNQDAMKAFEEATEQFLKGN